jgi:hypothetical protein
MGKAFEREYYRLSTAATELGCEVDDLIHWAATGRLSLGVLYEIPLFNESDYKYVSWKHAVEGTTPDSVDAFSGFVYVDSDNFQQMERLGGELKFSYIRLTNGRSIHKIREPKSETRSLAQIYIHSDDLRKLLSDGMPTTGDKPMIETGGAHVSDKLQFLKQAAYKFWAGQSETSRSTHPDNAAVEAWLMKCGFSAKEADAASSIIRPKWAKPGRKPKE